ncbi:MAG: hypothetical protein WCJ30_13880 [Deltaproteobacteria bacterium]
MRASFTVAGWARVFGAEGSESASSLALAADGDIVVAGSLVCESRADEDSCQQAFAARYSRDGLRRWIWIAGEGSSGVEAIWLETDGSVVLGGDFASTVDFDPRASHATLRAGRNTGLFRTRLTADGQHIATSRLGRRDWTNPGTLEMRQRLPDGAMLVTSTRAARQGGRRVEVAVLSKLTPRGVLVWRRAFESLPESIVSIACVQTDGSMFVTGTFVANEYDPLSGFVSKLDPLGAVLWTRTLAGERGVRPTGAIPGRDGSVLVSGHFQGDFQIDGGSGVDAVRYVSSENVFVMRLLSDGSRAWVDVAGGGFTTPGKLLMGPDGVVTLIPSFSGPFTVATGQGAILRTPRQGGADFGAAILRFSTDGDYIGALGLTGGTHPTIAAFDAAGALVLAGSLAGAAESRFSDTERHHDASGDDVDALVARIDPAALSVASLDSEQTPLHPASHR